MIHHSVNGKSPSSAREREKDSDSPHRESHFDDLINKKRKSYTVAQWEDGGESSNKLLISLWNQPNS